MTMSVYLNADGSVTLSGNLVQGDTNHVTITDNRQPVTVDTATAATAANGAETVEVADSTAGA